ncbi:Thiamine biosynthesis lipoprotein ApbE precursor [Caulifigura coniformis]|uniref:FAD:protein FMN transferase n=1 Tax=Caulifigura coniformis TaxID=2527983 RepID=A0A517SDY0_9PLAN|nr:FAD:protein FMN transferase [Caulifigura coniformis]QDT54317.1 Thiamine biosynthesis lipoprotein ApbE precursor [Caulifigura coniformis]
MALACALAVGASGFALPGPECRVFAQESKSAPQPAETRFEFEQVRFAAPVRLLVYAPSEALANNVSRDVFARLKQLDRIMSDYDPESELSRLCAQAGSGRPVSVSRELFDVLAESQRLAGATGGAFDITVAPVVKLWRQARRRKQLPTEAQLKEAMSLVGAKSLRLNEADRTAELLKPGMLLDLGGIAQGYAADEAMRILKEAGLPRSLVDVSGDIRVGDAPPGRDGWRVEVEALKSKTPLASPAEPHFVTLTNAAISTAGDAYQSTEIDGVRYSHIIDARTGRPMTESCSVTVIAHDALTADGLDTALCVLDDAGGRKLVKSVPGVRVYVARMKEGRVEASEFASDSK